MFYCIQLVDIIYCVHNLSLHNISFDRDDTQQEKCSDNGPLSCRKIIILRHG